MDSAATQTISLWDALKSVPDHRRPAGKRYPLASLLLIALAAMLAGRRDQLGIVRWGRRLKSETLAAIGINRARVPAPSVWCELFQELDVTALEQALGDWVRGEASPGHVAIDGKRLRGSATAQAPGTGLFVGGSKNSNFYQATPSSASKGAHADVRVSAGLSALFSASGPRPNARLQVVG